MPFAQGTTRSRHSALIDRMKRSACALRLAPAGVRTTRTPVSSSSSACSFGSRITDQESAGADVTALPKLRNACITKALSRCVVVPGTCTRREVQLDDECRVVGQRPVTVHFQWWKVGCQALAGT